MKLNYLLKIFSVIFVMGYATINLNATNSYVAENISGEPDSWIAIQNQNGIKVTCIPFELNGVSYLKVKFDNTTNQVIDFSWSLNIGNEAVVNETANSIKAKSYIETDQGTLIPFNDKTSQALYSFNLKIN